MAFVLALAMCLTGCGGEEGVGSGGSGITVGFGEGTVTTLGTAVAFDGTAFDTTKAPVQFETSPGTFGTAAVKLGQHVEFDFKVDRVADAVRVEPQVVGVVDSLGVGVFTVLGQRVRTNTDPGVGPVTVFAGYNGFRDVRINDVVEVHGLSRLDQSGFYVLQATRVEKQAQALPQHRLTGIVAGLTVNDDGSAGFLLGDVFVRVTKGTEFTADVARLANGQTVTVFGGLDVNSSFTASFLRIKNRQNSGIDAYFGGTLTQVDIGSSRRFEINGVPVSFDDLLGRTGYTPKDQQYVQLRGNFDLDGKLTVSAVSLRGAAGVDTEVEIEGPVTASDAASSTVLVRGFVVRFGGARVDDCSRGISVGDYIAVRGQAIAGGIVADRVRCFY